MDAKNLDHANAINVIAIILYNKLILFIKTEINIMNVQINTVIKKDIRINCINAKMVSCIVLYILIIVISFYKKFLCLHLHLEKYLKWKNRNK